MSNETHLGCGLYVHIKENGQWSEPYKKDPSPEGKPAAPTTASMLLGDARELLDQRAKDYDAGEGGERSMGKVAAMFNIATQRDGDKAISESEAWLVMALLKIVRDRSTEAGHEDSCKDLVSYSALYGEARLGELQAKTARMKLQLNRMYDGVAAEDIPAGAFVRAVPSASPDQPASPRPKVKPEPTVKEAVGVELRQRVIDAVVAVKENVGVKEARSLVANWGDALRVMEIPERKLIDVLYGAFKAYGPNLDDKAFIGN